jgi:hypothetical protein
MLQHRSILAKRVKIDNNISVKAEPGGSLSPEKKAPPLEDGDGEKQEKGLSPLEKYEENLKKNSIRIARMKIERMKEENKRANQKVTLFCNPLSMCDPWDAQEVNPKATIIVPADDPHNVFREELAFELEDTAIRQDRLKVFELIRNSVSPVVEASLLNTVAIGNTYALYSVVKKYLQVDERDNVIDNISKQLKSLKKRPKELFITFLSRYHGILHDMQTWNYSKDEAEMKNMLKNALQSDCELTARTYKSVITSHGTKLTSEELLDKMGLLMNELEREQEASRVKEKESKKQKKQAEKAASDAIALAVEAAGANRGGGNKGGRGKGGRGGGKGQNKKAAFDDDIKGVCQSFQDGKCSRGEDCYYKHVKLTKEQKERLISQVSKSQQSKAKENGIECYSCGKKGHIASQCSANQNPKTQKAQSKTVKVAEAKGSEMDQILDAIKHSGSFTDAQVVLLAKQMANQVIAKKEKKE